MAQPNCTSSLQFNKDATYSCSRPVGHDGSHSGGGMWWTGPGNGSAEGEPAPDRQPSDAAVEAGARAMRPRLFDDSRWEVGSATAIARGDTRASARAVLEAAAPLLNPRPLLDRDLVLTAVQHVYSRETDEPRWGAMTNAVMGLARPMSTPDAIALALFKHDQEAFGYQMTWDEAGVRRQATYLDRANAVLALLNGEIEKGEGR